MRHTIAVLVENRFGVLARVAGLFSGRGYNIESLNVAETLEAGVSHMTIVTSGEDHIIEQITKQLNKQIDVIKVVDLNDKKVLFQKQLKKSYTGATLEAARTAAFKQVGRDMGLRIATEMQ